MERRIASARFRAAGTAIAWPGALVLLVTLPQAPAFAEVCDKVAGHWSPGSAPTGFGPVVWAGLLLAGALVFFTRSLLVASLCACVCVLLATVVVNDMRSEHEVYRFAVIEGCRAPWRDGFEAFLLLAGAALFLVCGRMRRRTAK